MRTSSVDFEIKFFEGLVKDNPRFIDALIPLAEAYTKKGLHKKGLTIDKRLARLRKSDPVVHYNLACSYALLNQKKEALQALRKSIELGYDDFAYLLRDKDLKSLNQDPDFLALIPAKIKAFLK